MQQGLLSKNLLSLANIEGLTTGKRWAIGTIPPGTPTLVTINLAFTPSVVVLRTDSGPYEDKGADTYVNKSIIKASYNIAAYIDIDRNVSNANKLAVIANGFTKKCDSTYTTVWIAFE